jgi:hypothetical protein
MTQRNSDREISRKNHWCYETKKDREILREGTARVMTQRSSDREISQRNPRFYGTKKQ